MPLSPTAAVRCRGVQAAEVEGQALAVATLEHELCPRPSLPGSRRPPDQRVALGRQIRHLERLVEPLEEPLDEVLLLGGGHVDRMPLFGRVDGVRHRGGMHESRVAGPLRQRGAGAGCRPLMVADQPAAKAISRPAAIPPQRIQRACRAWRASRCPAAASRALGNGFVEHFAMQFAQRVALGSPGGLVGVGRRGGAVHGDGCGSLEAAQTGTRRCRRTGAFHQLLKPDARARERRDMTVPIGMSSTRRPARRTGPPAPPAAAPRAAPRAGAAGSAAGRWSGRAAVARRAVLRRDLIDVHRGARRRAPRWLANTLCMMREEPRPQVAARRSTAATCCRRAPACPAPGRRRPRRRRSARVHSA